MRAPIRGSWRRSVSASSAPRPPRSGSRASSSSTSPTARLADTPAARADHAGDPRVPAGGRDDPRSDGALRQQRVGEPPRPSRGRARSTIDAVFPTARDPLNFRSTSRPDSTPGRWPSSSCGARTRRTSSSTSARRSSEDRGAQPPREPIPVLRRDRALGSAPKRGARRTRRLSGSRGLPTRDAGPMSAAGRGRRWPADLAAPGASRPAATSRRPSRRPSQRRSRSPARTTRRRWRPTLPPAWAAGDYEAMYATLDPGAARASIRSSRSPSCTPRSRTWPTGRRISAAVGDAADDRPAAGAAARELPVPTPIAGAHGRTRPPPSIR